MNLRHIEVFHAVYTTGSVSAAARLLHVSQPAVTNLLRHAESVLGFPLFERSRGRLVPTADAHDLYAQADAIQGQVQQMRETARNMRRGRGQTLRISTLPSLGMELLPEALAGYLARHSGVSIELHTIHHDDVAAKLARRETDVVICYTPPRDTLLKSTLLGTGEMVALFQEADFPDAPEPLPLASLQDRKLIATFESGPQGRMISEELARREIEPEVVGASRTFFVAAAMARAGLGMTIVDTHTALAMQAPGMATRKLDPPQRYDIHAVSLEARPPSQLALDFLDHLRTVLQSHK
ncbi:DNA-binding transcriptional LysR family regulator [Novosphingobium sp. PhB165]|uniref:LysR family transcriptional regulator n=1 Tax=Novosphingobium sp. PhB165 TaxID=2485105 RepID=UPI001046A9D5|nr:LysR family transcriptional regulator [Novosphingobium sp. PhB165]TCM15673.1 DNA-binding transcriptional LysR family regulator [Novosphingobium sp. PhB165]